MYLPNVEEAIVEDSKLTQYLLNLKHSDGAGKANYFIGKGYSPDRPDQLRRDFITHARLCEVCHGEDTEFGIKYVVEGSIMTSMYPHPKLEAVLTLRTVWMILHGSEVPILVTAYPINNKSYDSTI